MFITRLSAHNIISPKYTFPINPSHLASGVRLCSLTASSLATITAAAPSQMPGSPNDDNNKTSRGCKCISTPEAPPAVTTPPFLNTGGSFANCSRVVLGFGCSSNFISTSFFLILRVIGVISSAKTPASAAAPHVCCDRKAKASQSSLNYMRTSALHDFGDKRTTY